MRPGAGRPLLLGAPSRFAGRGRTRARWLLALLAALMLASLTALPAIHADRAGVTGEHGDELLYALVVEDMRHGADYYAAAADALRIGGYPLRPFTAFRLPTLAVLQAPVSSIAAALLLYALALLALFAWWQRLGDATPRLAPRAAATLLAALGMAGAFSGELVVLHEPWAGVLIALSLAMRRPGRWVTAAALALSAMLLRETAALYAAIMAVAALRDGERREAAGWAAALGVFAIVLAVHAHAVGAVVRPLDQPASDWAAIPGFGRAIGALVEASALASAPAVIAALAAGLSLAGWAAWRDPLATRALATLLGYTLLLCFVGGTGAGVAALLVAPFALVGLAFLPDAIRDLTRAALDRRRVTVTRTAA